VAVVWWLVRQYALMGWLLLAGWLVVLGYVGFEISRLGKVVRDRLLLALLLVFGSVIFFAPSAGFWTVTPANTQAFNPGYILLFSAPLAWLWTKLGQAGRDPNPLVKFGLGLVQIGVGFWVLTWAAANADASFKTPLVFMAFSYLLQTTGELFLSPVGLSEMTKLAPARMISTMMAIWFLGASGAQYIAGLIARTTAAETIGGQVLDPAKSLATYAHTFLVIGAWGVGAGVVFLVVSPWLKRWAHGADDAHVVAEATSPLIPAKAGTQENA
jgi:POT family proton-dependent oligopeptide transporter